MDRPSWRAAARRHAPTWLVLLAILGTAAFLAHIDREDHEMPCPDATPQPELPGTGIALAAQIDLQLGWSGEEFRYAEPMELFVCTPGGGGGEVAIHGPDGLHARPSHQFIDPQGTGVLRFQLAVDPGTRGAIHVAYDFGGGGGTESVEVDGDRDRWWLEPWGSSG